MPLSASPSTASLEQLLSQVPNLWRGREHGEFPTLDSGWEALNRALPGGGWPRGALIELMPRCEGIGELTLTLPSLRSLAREGRSVALVRPPFVPYAPALRRAQLPLKRLVWIAEPDEGHALWAAEQLLRGGAGAVLLWCDVADDRPLRRLQLAAESTQALAFLYRPLASSVQASPAALRIELAPETQGLRLHVLKVRGGSPCEVALSLPLGSAGA
jgi:hypothetical protein